MWIALSGVVVCRFCIRGRVSVQNKYYDFNPVWQRVGRVGQHRRCDRAVHATHVARPPAVGAEHLVTDTRPQRAAAGSETLRVLSLKCVERGEWRVRAG